MIDGAKFILALIVVAVSVYLYYLYSDLLQIARVGIVIAGVLVAAGVVYTTSVGKSSWEFVRGANIERRKVVWPTPRETFQVTLMVILFTIFLGLLIWMFDWLSFSAVYNWILGVSI